MKSTIIKKDLKNLAIVLGLLLFQFGSYFLSKQLIHDPIILNNEIEDQIPHVPFFVVFYMSWYVLLIIVPFMLSRKNEKYFKIYIVTNLTCYLIVFIFYVFLPTAVKIPIIESNDIFSFLCNVIYSADVQQNSAETIGYAIACNVFPSGHTIASMLFIYSCVCCKQIKRSTTAIIIFMSIGIIFSTILIKQHVIIDDIAGFIIVTTIFFIVKYFYNKKSKSIT